MNFYLQRKDEYIMTTNTMTNLQRLQLEIQQSGFTDDELSIFLEENSLSPNDEYNPSSNQSKRAIYQSALTVLEAIANNPELMASRKFDDTSVLDFADNLQNRIDQLERKIRQLPSSDTPQDNSNTFMLFGN
jgi:hypothetical protein